MRERDDTTALPAVPPERPDVVRAVAGDLVAWLGGGHDGRVVLIHDEALTLRGEGVFGVAKGVLRAITLAAIDAPTLAPAPEGWQQRLAAYEKTLHRYELDDEPSEDGFDVLALYADREVLAADLRAALAAAPPGGREGLAYIREHYSVPAYLDVEMLSPNGQRARIVGTDGPHLAVVAVDTDELLHLHPTWNVTYLPPAASPPAAPPGEGGGER